MANTIWALAELSWRQLFPGGSDEAKVTLEEFVSTAKGELARIAFVEFQEGRKEGDLSFINNFLQRPRIYKLEEDADGFYVELESDLEVLDLPYDTGIFRVKPNAPGAVPLTRSQSSSYNLFKNDPGGAPPFFREGRRISFPQGVGCRVASVAVTVATLNAAGDDMEVPERLAPLLRDALQRRYGPSAGMQGDDTNNQNPNQ